MEAMYVRFQEDTNVFSSGGTAPWFPDCPSHNLVTVPTTHITGSNFPKYKESNCWGTNSPQEDRLLPSVQTAVSEPQHFQRNIHRSVARYVPMTWELAQRQNRHCTWSKQTHVKSFFNNIMIQILHFLLNGHTLSLKNSSAGKTNKYHKITVWHQAQVQFQQQL